MTWTAITPEVHSEAEFHEILNDFGDPLEILREAISNALDAKATELEIEFAVKDVDGSKRLVVRLKDNGLGMTQDALGKDFWGLGFSTARGDPSKIGEKGHGTKIYLGSERVEVRTVSKDGEAFEAVCERPKAALSKGQLHKPQLRKIEAPWNGHGTEIVVVGYNDNERTRFVQEVVKDYLLWYTKLGSIELQFGDSALKGFKVRLKCIGAPDFEEVSFGHPFPAENADIEALFAEKQEAAADWYVRRWVWKNERLSRHPEVTFDAVISVEGDEVKRAYNPMIRARRRADTGRYKVADRYGLWLCKDHIPIVRVNEWISGFGTGSNSFVLLHGFVNCQELRLTANRGTIANTDPQILQELRERVAALISDVDKELREDGVYTLRDWQAEGVTLKQESADFAKRVKDIKARPVATLEGRKFLEPRNESELFGLFTSIVALKPELFDFEPLDYNTTRGIDLIARNRGAGAIAEGEYWYVELKHRLKRDFNHAFRHLRWVVCWDFDPSLHPGAEVQGIEDGDTRKLEAAKDDEGHPIYYLENKKKALKIQVIRLKEYLATHLGLVFQHEIPDP